MADEEPIDLPEHKDANVRKLKAQLKVEQAKTKLARTWLDETFGEYYDELEQEIASYRELMRELDDGK